MKKVIYIIAIILPVMIFGQSQNYILSKTYKKPFHNGISNPSITDAAVTITYFDGLGRPIQKNAAKQASDGNDILTIVDYDSNGRQSKEYLPIKNGQSLNFHSIDSMDVISYYSTPRVGFPEITTSPFSEKIFESSPLNRVLQQTAPGEHWKKGSGHEIKFEYLSNTDEDNVMILKANTSWLSNYGVFETTYVKDGKYSENKLYKTITKDENWVSGKLNTTEEFKDIEGHVILKRNYNLIDTNIIGHDTYYVYDTYGNLSYVIPPLVADPSNVSENELNSLCYQYKYDQRNRLVEKKLPGKQWEFIIYNNLDKPVLTGPTFDPWGNGNEGWLITKYDAYGRVIYTGWIEGEVNRTQRNSLLHNVNNTGNYEIFDKNNPIEIDGIQLNYSNSTYPTNFNLLTVNYYDTYNTVLEIDFPNQIEGVEVLDNVMSLPTVSWVRVLDSIEHKNGNSTYTFYDRKGRAIRTQKNNYLGGYTKVDSSLDFSGKVLSTNTYHKITNEAQEINVHDTFEYTDQDRLLNHKQEIVNKHPIELIANNEYDDLGQLISKQVGGSDISNYIGLQKVDYEYNIRGWLKGINNIQDFNQSNAPLDLFAFHINYDEVDDDINGQLSPLFNGNISETYWRSNSDNVLRKYGYAYDNLNRLNKAIYQRPGGTTPVTHMYDEEINYDMNGNITHLNRYGDYDSSNYTDVIQTDNLEYTYDDYNKNQLVKVTDLTNHPSGFKDDSDGINDAELDYSYDSNGNLTSDQNKSINQILYNHLNLPTEINFDIGYKINYLYDASGQKVKKTVTEGENITNTDYMDGYQYSNGILNFFPHSEGYVNVAYCGQCETEVQFIFNYVYNYLDHLGNIRLTYTLDPKDAILKILEENHYYPFGLKHKNYNSGRKKYTFEDLSAMEQDGMPEWSLKVAPVTLGEKLPYKYKYQGKERQDELGLNWDSFKWRNYDYAIGRFMSIDPLTEKYVDWTPYAFSGNRVVDSRELEGLEPVQVTKNTNVLIITVNGSAGGPNGDKIVGNNSQVKNLPNGYNNNDDGLSMLGTKGWDVLNSQIVNYAGSESGITAEHIAQTIANYRETNPDGKVAIIGHSLGGKNALDAANLVNGNSSIKNKSIDLLMTMEAAERTGPMSASGYGVSVGDNVKNLVNFTSATNSYPGAGGTAGNSTNTLNVTLPSGTSHTNMDNTITRYLPLILHQTNVGQNPINVVNSIDWNKAKILNNGDIKPNAQGGSSY